MKRILLSILLCLCMVAALLPATAFAATITTLKDQPKMSGSIITHVGKTSKEATIYLDASMKNSFSKKLAEGTEVYLTHYAPQVSICIFTYSGKKAYILASSLTDVEEVTMPEQNERAVVTKTATVKNTTGTTTSFYVRKTAEAVNGTNCFGIYYEGSTLNIIDSDYSTDWMKIKYTDGYIGYFQKKFIDASTLTDVAVDTTQPTGNYISASEDAAQATGDGLTMTINSDEDWRKLTTDNMLHYSRLVLNNAAGEKDLQWYKDRMAYFAAHHIEEIWFAPGYDVTNYLYELESSRYLQYGVICSGAMNRGNCYVVVSDTTPASQYENRSLNHGLKTYSGDLSAAVAKGVSAAKNPCTKHVYNQQIETADRVASYVTCTAPTRYYYSCENCGQCEYNKNHTFVMEGPGHIHKSEASHDMGAQDITDAAYIGVNTAGQRVYWESCYACGKSYAQDLLDSAPSTYKTSGMSAELTYAQYLDSVKSGIAARESKALAGGNTSQMFTVNGSVVSAGMSKWAQNDVNWAKQNGLIDEVLLGSDYTKAMTRLQFCSVAVKLAEKMSGTTIEAAPSNTFSDTSDEYVLKAYAANITGGTGNGKFSPGATINRQQMAAFLYRALQYVKENSTVRYTAYTSNLGSYADSGSIESWAKEPMAFMNALGLIGGTSASTLSPANQCTIEQALVVANRSLDADQIGWYLVRSDKELRGHWVGIFAPFKTANYSAALTYAPGEKYWVADIRRSDFSKTSDMLYVTDPYTGARLTAYAENFTPIREK